MNGGKPRPDSNKLEFKEKKTRPTLIPSAGRNMWKVDEGISR